MADCSCELAFANAVRALASRLVASLSWCSSLFLPVEVDAVLSRLWSFLIWLRAPAIAALALLAAFCAASADACAELTCPCAALTADTALRHSSLPAGEAVVVAAHDSGPA